MVNCKLGLLAVPKLTTAALVPAAPVIGVGNVKLGTIPNRPGAVQVSVAVVLELTKAIETHT
jgi:hypothetical protein